MNIFFFMEITLVNQSQIYTSHDPLCSQYHALHARKKGKSIKSGKSIAL